MDSSELLRRLEGEGELTSRQDEAPTDSSADSRANKALRAEMGPRLDDLMGLLAWLKTEQAKLGGRGKTETIERTAKMAAGTLNAPADGLSRSTLTTRLAR